MMARQLGLPLTGALGVLLRAKKMRRIKALKPELEALKRRAHLTYVGNCDFEKSQRVITCQPGRQIQPIGIFPLQIRCK